MSRAAVVSDDLVLAFCGLSAAWIYADDQHWDLAVATLAADELSRSQE
jgi:streptomycin 6-kinase